MSEKSGSGKALIYCRVSTDEQVEKGYSLKTQEEQCRQYCGTHKMDVEYVFNDEGNLEELSHDQLSKSFFRA